MTIDKGQVNTRERALSSDINRMVELGNRATVEALAAGASGLSREYGVFGDTSFLVTPQNGTMKSAIGPGLAIFYDATKVFPQSPMVWIESRQIREVTHAPADALARWDVIEMRPGEQVSSTQPRDQFDSLTGTFTVVNMVKEIQSWPEFQIRSGTPSASPGIPAGTPGWIPLAYVKVGGNAVAVVSTEVVYCRPLLGARQIDREGWTTSTLNSIYARDVKGGGIEFDGGANDLSGLLVNTVTGRFGSTPLGAYHHNFRILKTVAVRVTSMTIDGGIMPAVDDVMYFYAIPPPYPAGYGAQLAGRELWTPDTANLYGTNGGFYDSALQNGCIIIASAKEPDITNPAGPPLAGTGSFAHEFFADAGNATSTASSWVYIGAGCYVQATNEILLQKCVGSTVSTFRKPGKSFTADLPIAAPISYNLWTEAAGDPVVRWPVTARAVDVHLRSAINNNGNLTIELADEFGDTTGNKGVLTAVFPNNSGGQQNCGTIVPMHLSDTGTIIIANATHTGVASANLYASKYRDSILDSR
jgi:hypothetical protein